MQQGIVVQPNDRRLGNVFCYLPSSGGGLLLYSLIFSTSKNIQFGCKDTKYFLISPIICLFTVLPFYFFVTFAKYKRKKAGFIMETKKSHQADLEGRRIQGFLLGLILVLALLFVALEWNSDAGWSFFEQEDDIEAELELEPLKREDDQIPMMLPQEPKEEQPKSEELRVVEDDVELVPEIAQDTPNPEIQETPVSEEPQPEVVDMYDKPMDIRVVEDLPQFPGGAAEFMKWLTKNLKYPATAQQQKVKGRVVAEFIVNKDGSVTDLQLVEHLNLACDNEVLRVLRMMPNWEPGFMNAKPCRTKVCIPVVFNM